MTFDPRSPDLPADRPVAATAVLLPGTGSDADFVRRALGPLAGRLAGRTVAAEATAAGLVDTYRAALDRASAEGPVLVAGVSIGAMIGARWAADHPGAVAGMIAAMPAWCGPAADAPAAASARYTAHLLRTTGLASTIAAMRAGSPGWLADELARSWTALGSGLADTMDEAGHHDAIDAAGLAAVSAPVAIVHATDDPLHPAGVAQDWAAALPRAARAAFTLAELGADPAVLSRAGARAWAAVTARPGAPA